MRQFVYFVAEGVLDVVFVSQVLRHRYSLQVVSRKPDLIAEASKWLDQFKWPVGDDIRRLAVPAPVFLQNEHWIVGFRNAGGLQGIRKTIVADHEAFLRLSWQPAALGIILDADDQSPLERFAGFVEILRYHGYPQPPSMGSVAITDALRAGIFAFPGDAANGTIEDVLLPIAESRFPALTLHASEYVANWAGEPATDFVDLNKPSGRKKARLSALTALLKPGKSPNASIEDQYWISPDLEKHAELRPLLKFLDAILAEGPPKTTPTTETAG